MILNFFCAIRNPDPVTKYLFCQPDKKIHVKTTAILIIGGKQMSMVSLTSLETAICYLGTNNTAWQTGKCE